MKPLHFTLELSLPFQGRGTQEATVPNGGYLGGGFRPHTRIGITT